MVFGGRGGPRATRRVMIRAWSEVSTVCAKIRADSFNPTRLWRLRSVALTKGLTEHFKDASVKIVGRFVGRGVGESDVVGLTVGRRVGRKLGRRVGLKVGSGVGSKVGSGVGTFVGFTVGYAVGFVVGTDVGYSDGRFVGPSSILRSILV